MLMMRQYPQIEFGRSMTPLGQNPRAEFRRSRIAPTHAFALTELVYMFAVYMFAVYVYDYDAKLRWLPCAPLGQPLGSNVAQVVGN